MVDFKIAGRGVYVARIRIMPTPPHGKTTVLGEFDGIKRACNEPFVARVLTFTVLVGPSTEYRPVISLRNENRGGLVGGFDRASALATLRFTSTACKASADGIEGSEVRRSIVVLATRTVANSRSGFLDRPRGYVFDVEICFTWAPGPSPREQLPWPR